MPHVPLGDIRLLVLPKGQGTRGTIVAGRGHGGKVTSDRGHEYVSIFFKAGRDMNFKTRN